jgi:hypothetical protein
VSQTAQMNLPALDDARALLMSLFAPEGNLNRPVSSADLGWLDAHRLAPFVFYRLQQAGALARLPADVRAALGAAYYTAAANWTLLSSELSALLADLRPLGVEPIVLKGMALGVTLYPAPATRPTSDLDLLVGREGLSTIRQVLQARGYRDMGLEEEQRQAFTSHLYMWRESPRIMVESHWHLVHDPGYAGRVTLDDFLARATPTDFGGYTARVLDPIDQLLHACAHLSFTHPQEWHLLWLLDLRLLVERYGPAWDWGEVVERAARKGLAGSVRYWLELTATWFGAFMPERAAQALASARPGADETRYLDVARTGHTRVADIAWRHAFGDANLWRGLGYLRETFFPPWAYMQFRYGARSRWLAPVYYGWRIIRAGRVAFQRVGRPPVMRW